MQYWRNFISRFFKKVGVGRDSLGGVFPKIYLVERNCCLPLHSQSKKAGKFFKRFLILYSKKSEETTVWITSFQKCLAV